MAGLSDTRSDRAVDFRRALPEVCVTSRDYLTMKPIIAWLKNVAPSYAGGVFLDFGCGNKPYRDFYARNVEKYIGVDVIQNKFGTVDLVVPAESPVPMPDGSVDTVLSTQVLEHVTEPEGYIREVFRLIKPGGHFILTCPASFMLHEEPNDYYRFTKYGVTHLLRKTGFRVIRIDTAGGAWALMGQILLNHKAFARKFTIPLLSKTMYLCWVVGINLLFSFFDRVNLNIRDTANYMIIAQK